LWKSVFSLICKNCNPLILLSMYVCISHFCTSQNKLAFRGEHRRTETTHNTPIADRGKIVLESCIIRKSLVCKSDNEVCVEMLYVKFFNLILFIVIIGFNMRTWFFNKAAVCLCGQELIYSLFLLLLDLCYIWLLL